MKTPRQQQLEEYLEEDASDPFLHYALALEMLNNHQAREGTDKLQWVLNQFPSYLATYYQLGKCLEAENNHQAAAAVYGAGMKLAAEQQNHQAFRELKSALEEITN